MTPSKSLSATGVAPAPQRTDPPPPTEIASLRRQLEFRQLLSEVSTHFINLPAEEIDGQIQRALGQIGSFLGFNLVASAKFSGERSAGEVTHIWTAEGLPPVPPGFTELDFPWIAERLVQGEPVHLACLDDFPPAGRRDRQTYEQFRIRSAYNWPLQVAGATIGCLGLCSVGKEHPFPAEFEEELELLAQIIASTLARQRADQALHESEARLSLAADAAGAGLWRLNLASSQFWLTSQTRELFNFTADEVVTFERFLSVVHPDDQELIRQKVQAMVRSKSDDQVEYRILRPDGSLRWMLSRGRVLSDTSGKRDYLMGVSMDVTEQRRAEFEIQQLRMRVAHFGRVTLLGQLASALAHQLSQPLGAILRNAEAAELLLQQSAPDLDELRAIITDIHEDDQRAGEVIDRLRSLLKRQALDPRPLQLDGIIAEVLSLLHADAAARKVNIECQTAPGLPPARCDRIHLQQVLLNLLVNAMDALATCEPGARNIQVSVQAKEAGMITIRICDNGPGLPVATLNKLFEPFFTTKANGMGMGLAVSKTIIEAHKGKIWAENRPEGGACFCFTLPAAGDAVKAERGK